MEMFKDILDEFDAFQDDTVDTVSQGSPEFRIKISKKDKHSKKSNTVEHKESLSKTVTNIENETDEFEEIGNILSEKYGTSDELNSKYLIGLKEKALSQKTFNGIDTELLRDILTVSASESMDWDHVIMQADPLYFVDIAGKKMKELATFDFVEELCPVNIDREKFGLNNSLMNRIEYILISKRLAVIEDYTFALYKKLKRVSIEEGSVLNKIGIGAFSYCESLKEIDLSRCELLSYLPSNVILGSGVTKIILPDNLDKIAVDAFKGSKLTSIEIGGYTYTIDEFMTIYEASGYKAFWKCFDYEF